MITANIPSSFKPGKALRASIAAALGLALTTTSTWANTAGQNAINTQLAAMNTTGGSAGPVPVGTTLTKAKAADLLLAVSMAIEADLANPTVTGGTLEIVKGALEAFNTKFRADRSTLAPQLIATAVAADPSLADSDLGDVTASATAFGNLVAQVYNINNGNTAGALTAVGRGAVMAQAIKSSVTTEHAAAVGSDSDWGSAGLVTDVTAYSTLLQNVIKSLKTTTYTYDDQLQAFAGGLMTSKVDAAFRDDLALVVAQKTAGSNTAGAGAVMGGYVDGAGLDDTGLKTLAQSTIADPKLQKALGEILARTMVNYGDHDQLASDLLTDLLAQNKPNYALVTQGLLRSGNATNDVTDILDDVLSVIQNDIARLSSFAGVVTTRTGTGSDSAKLVNIVNTIAEAGPNDAPSKSQIAISVLSATGVDNPEVAGVVIGTIIDSDAGATFVDDFARTLLAQTVAAKVKAYAAVGYMAGEVVGRNIADSGVNALADASQGAVGIMLKNASAATDIAQRVAALSGIGIDKAEFANSVSDLQKKFVQNVAIGVSLADPRDAGNITTAAITHDVVLDKGALGKAVTIAVKVADAVDAEAAADIAKKLAEQMAKVPTGAKPLKIAMAAKLAAGLAKSIQNKAGVTTANRMDELGEIGAVITAGILDEFGTDQASLSKALIGVGKSLITALSKKELLDTRTQKADLTEARDIVGSILQTISTSSLDQAIIDYLLGETLVTGFPNPTGVGPLETAWLKLVGKPGTTHYVEVQNAVNDVVGGSGATKFEDGNNLDPTDPNLIDGGYDPITDTVNG